jgi:hypothetical protein
MALALNEDHNSVRVFNERESCYRGHEKYSVSSQKKTTFPTLALTNFHETPWNPTQVFRLPDFYRVERFWGSDCDPNEEEVERIDLLPYPPAPTPSKQRLNP